MQEGLKRVLTLKDVIIFGIGIIVGAGIYSIIGKAAGIAGYGVWVSVLIAGIITAFTGMSFAEMTSMYPKTSGYFKLIKSGLEAIGGKAWGFVVEWCMIFACIFSIATIAIAFGGYFSSFFPMNITLTAILLIFITGIIALLGVKESVTLTILFTFVEVTGLVVVIILGLFFVKPDIKVFFNFEWSYNIFLASSLIIFAYTGFELIPAQAEETVKPKKLIPRAIVGSIVASMIIYVLVAIATVNLFDVKLLGASDAPLVDAVAERFGSNASAFIWFSAVVATSSTVLGIVVTSSRLLYGLGKEKLFPGFFSKIFKNLKTPYVAIAFICSIGMFATILIQDLKTTAEIANFLTLLTFYFVNISIIVLRWFKPKIKREFKVPISIKNTPLPSLAGSILCMIMLVNFPAIILFNGIFIVAVSLIFYYLTRKAK